MASVQPMENTAPGDVLITLGGGNVITVQNMTTADVLTQIVW